MLEDVERALNLAKAGAWGDAEKVLRASHDPLGVRLSLLFAERKREEREMERLRSVKRHKLANLVSIALANLEAIQDGALTGTPQRFHNIREALRTAGKLLEEMREPKEGTADDTALTTSPVVKNLGRHP